MSHAADPRDLPAGIYERAAEAIHGHRCRHQYASECTGPSDTDRAYARAALSPAVARLIAAAERERILSAARDAAHTLCRPAGDAAPTAILRVVPLEALEALIGESGD